MTDNKSKPTELTSDVLIADVMLRLTALEKLLIQKGLMTKEELQAMTNILVENVTKVIMDKVQSAKDLDDFVVSLGTESKNKLNN
jgi:hypothetical protein